MPPAAARTPATCPSCSAAVSGRFCSECGAAIEGATCGACRTILTPGAKFCHRCGTAVGAPPPHLAHAQSRSVATVLPWTVAAIALLAVIALVAGQRMGAGRGGGQSSAFSASADGGGDQLRAPDISSLSPRERADRLFDRVMRLSSEGKGDSVQLFAPMALAAYQMLDSLDADLRYDLGRVAEVSGAVDIARAQADTILRAEPTHLLGLVLASRAATLANDDAARRSFDRRLLAAEGSEMQKTLPEYGRHRSDIVNAVAEARRRPAP